MFVLPLFVMTKSQLYHVYTNIKFAVNMLYCFCANLTSKGYFICELQSDTDRSRVIFKHACPLRHKYTHQVWVFDKCKMPFSIWIREGQTADDFDFVGYFYCMHMAIWMVRFTETNDTTVLCELSNFVKFSFKSKLYKAPGS